MLPAPAHQHSDRWEPGSLKLSMSYVSADKVLVTGLRAAMADDWATDT